MKVLLRSVFLLVIGLYGLHADTVVNSSSLAATDTVSPTVKCPPGFVPFHTECVRSLVQTVTADVILHCSPGYSLTADGYCVNSLSSYSAGQSGYNNANVAASTPSCPSGYHYKGNTCWPLYTNPVVIKQFPGSSASSSCPNGYYYNGVTCALNTADYKIAATYSCPTGYNYDKGQCLKRTTSVKVQQGEIVCPYGYKKVGKACQTVIHSGSNGHLNSLTHTGAGQSSVLEIEKNLYVTTVNDIKVPVNITNLNNQTMLVDSQGNVLQPNSDSGKPSAVPTELPTEDITPNEGEEGNCCEVVSPRVCKQKPNNDWFCFHRRTEKCGKICTAPVMYIRPSQPMVRPGHMIIPPNYSRPTGESSKLTSMFLSSRGKNKISLIIGMRCSNPLFGNKIISILLK